MTRLRAAFILAAFLAAAVPASAQETVVPRELLRTELRLDSPWLAILRGHYDKSDEKGLLKAAKELLDDLEDAPGIAGMKREIECCNYGRHVYQVIFMSGTNADASLVRVFVSKRDLRPGTLPGISGPKDPVIEVFLAEDASVRLKSVYLSEPQENPLEKASGEFVSLVIGKLALPTSADVLTIGKRPVTGETAPIQEPEPPIPPLTVTLGRVDLPDSRARETIEHTLIVSDILGHLRARSEWLVATLGSTAGIEALRESKASYNGCPKLLEALNKAIDESSKKGDCAPLKLEPGGCFKEIRAAIGSAYAATVTAQGGCTAAYSIAQKFDALVPAKTAPAKGSVTLMNTPATRLTFGVTTAFITHVKTDNQHPRVKIQSGKIGVDPFTRLLAMGTINYIPAGYDPQSVRMKKAERVRLFGGIAFTRYFGATAGVSYAFNRYVGASVGYARLWYDSPKPGETLDAEPTPANKAAPFRLRGTNAAFVGLSYSVK